jgi:PAS domain S-box-containing protein
MGGAERIAELETLRRKDARYQAVLRASGAIIWTTDAQGAFIERQPSLEEYTGKSWEAYAGSRWISLIHPDDRARVFADWRSAVASGAELYRSQGRLWSARHQGWRAFQACAVPVRDSAGKIIEWVGVATDIQDVLETERTLLEKERALTESRLALHEQREQLRRLVESNIIGIVSSRISGVVHANDAFLRIIGRTRAELEAGLIDWQAITPPEFHKRDQHALAQLVTRGECEPYEKEYIRPDSTRVPILLGAVRLSREPLEWVSFIIDITAQKRAEAALAQAKAAAEQASAEKTHILASASHDLRQPLQALAAIVSMLATRPHDEAEAALIARADRAVATLAEMLNTLLDVSQLDAGVVRPAIQDFPLQRLLQSLREEFEVAAHAGGLRYEVSDCAAWVRSDPALLGRILRNLVSNAVKYTPPGGTVRIVCTAAADRLAIAVCDTGIGIPPEMHAAVFEDFRQLGNPERDRGKGLGLGLAIVARMARLLGHGIDLRSAAGEGSTFTVTLPLASPRAVGEEPGRRLPDGKRVLLVEDDELVRVVLEEMLAAVAYRVTSVGTADEALQAIETAAEPFDAVISDFRLPGATGLDVVERARHRFPAATAIILTGDTYSVPLSGAAALGIKLLRKPATEAALAEALAFAG